MDNMKPCPFCGSEAELITTGNEYTKSRSATIKCTKCYVEKTIKGIRSTLPWLSAEIIRWWNTRKESANG